MQLFVLPPSSGVTKVTEGGPVKVVVEAVTVML